MAGRLGIQTPDPADERGTNGPCKQVPVVLGLRVDGNIETRGACAIFVDAPTL